VATLWVIMRLAMSGVVGHLLMRPDLILDGNAIPTGGLGDFSAFKAETGFFPCIMCMVCIT